MSQLKDLIKTISNNPTESSETVNKCIELVADEFILDGEDVANLNNVITGSVDSSSDIVLLLQLVADINKYESNRTDFTDKALLMKVIELLMSNSPGVSLQAIRCLGNICAENEGACNLFHECGGIEKIVAKGEFILKSDDEEWIKIIPNACACIRNMVINNETVHAKFLDNNALIVLWKFLEKFHATNSVIAKIAISGIEALADSESGLQHLEKEKVFTSMNDLLLICSDEILQTLLQEMLLDYGKKEASAGILCKCGFVPTLCQLIEKRPNYNEVECKDPAFKELADLVVLLTSAEEGFTFVEPDFLSRLSRWIECPNIHLQVSAGLILGNYARSDEKCEKIVSNKIHENLIKVMKEHLDNEAFFDRFQSYGSCLRNLAIPAQTKSVLIADGLHLLAVELVKKPSLGVQLKGLGIIRLLTQGNASITTPLLIDNEFVSKVCELSDVSCVTSVPSEAQRLMASLFKHNGTEEHIRNAISLGGFKPVLALLNSDHVIMQNEGLVGLIIAIANVPDCLPSVKENKILSKVTELMRSPEVQTQTLFNCITLTQAVLSLDSGIDALKEHDIVETFNGIKEHKEEIIRNKVVETLGLLN